MWSTRVLSVILVAASASIACGQVWEQATAEAPWAARTAHGCLAFAGKIWVFGGRDSNQIPLDDVWFSADGVNWTEATAHAGWAPRINCCPVVHDGKMWILGGWGVGGQYLNDVWWSTDGVAWTEATSAASWSPRYNGACESFNGKMWMLGGRSGSYVNDVWSSTDGVDWVQETPSAAFPRAASHGSVVLDDKMCIMGGWTGGAFTDDVHCSTNGVDWTLATSAPGWTERGWPSPVVWLNNIWIMSGVNDQQPHPWYFNDVWYSQSADHWCESSASPGFWPARTGQATVVFDDKIWVLGGYNSEISPAYLNDVWYLGLSPINCSDDFEDGCIDPLIWNWGCINRGYAGSPAGDWQCSQQEIQSEDGHLNMRVWGPTSANTYGAEVWVRTAYDFNDDLCHTINFTWEVVVEDLHMNEAYIQITDGFVPLDDDVHWAYDPPPGTTDLLWRPSGGTEYPGIRLPSGLAESTWSVVIEPNGVAHLYNGPDASGLLVRQETLDPAYPWFLRLMLIDATSAGFPGGDTSLNLYEVTEACCSSLPAQPEYLALPSSPKSRKARYLSFGAGDAGRSQAIRVTYADLPVPYDSWNETQMWVGEPVTYCENSGQSVLPGTGCAQAGGLSTEMKASTLQCDPHFTDWSSIEVIQVFHEGIVPSGIYEVQVVDESCELTDAAAYSDLLEVTMSRWGDVVSDCTTNPCGPPDGVVGITTDVTAILDKFKNLPGNILKVRADIEPAVPDQLVNITDVTYALSAFLGSGYPFVSGEVPCGFESGEDR